MPGHSLHAGCPRGTCVPRRRSQPCSPTAQEALSAHSLPTHCLPCPALLTPQVRLEVRDKLAHVKNGKYVVVAGITPTPLGEGKR